MNNLNPLSTLDVAVGVIVNAQQQYLVARRAKHVDQGDLWEFPGGKIEQNESVFDALCRELHEELNIKIITAQPLVNVEHSYEKYHVILHTWLVEDFEGVPAGAEGQPVRWVDFAELQTLAMPAATAKILAAMRAY